MATLSFSELPQLKEAAARCGFDLHMHDACGAQSFSIEPVGERQSDGIYPAIADFFAARGIEVEFYDSQKRNFIAK